MKSGKTLADFRSKLIGKAPLFIWIVSLLFPATARTQSVRPTRVVVLYWYNKDYSWNVNFDRSFQAALQSAGAGRFEYYAEYLESDRFPGERQSRLLRDYLKQKYADRVIDAVIANSDASLDFLLKYRDDLFPTTPIVFITTQRPPPETLALGRGITGLITLSDSRKTVDLALRLHPDTKELFIISGTLQRDKRLEKAAREELHGFEDRVQISYLTDCAPYDLIAKMKTLRRGALVLYVWQQVEAQEGRVLEAHDILAAIAGSATVPIYGISNTYVGEGAVGGYINTAEVTGTAAGERVIQITNGTLARDIPVENAPIVPIFDWQQLRRWRISENELPADSIVRFKEPSLWDQHKTVVLGALTLFALETGLIGWLLVEHRRRRIAEKAKRDLAAIVESSDDAIIGASLGGEILSWNSGAESMYGYTAAAMLGRNFSIVVPPEKMDEFSENLKRRQRGEPIQHFESVRLNKDGTRIDVSVSLSTIKDDKGRIQAIASISRDISSRKRAELELQRLTTHLLNLQDTERRRIARELHDVTAQNILTIHMNLSRLRQRPMDARESQLVAECCELCNQALQEIRTLSYVLHPPSLDETGLVGALKWYVRGFSKRSGIHFEMSAIQEIGRLSSDVETALFRVVQESLTNIWRHSASSSAEIRLEKTEDQIVLQIRDYGRGMPKGSFKDMEGAESPGVGIAGMRQRLRQFGGTLEIESKDRGTLVIVKTPIGARGASSEDLTSRRWLAASTEEAGDSRRPACS